VAIKDKCTTMHDVVIWRRRLAGRAPAALLPCGWRLPDLSVRNMLQSISSK
jgi:hypothetical protein